VLLGQLVPSLTGQIIYCALFGASFGAYITSLSVVIQQIGADFTRSLGLSLLVFAVSSVAGPALVTGLFSTAPLNTSQYLPGFMAAGGAGLLGASLLPVVHFLSRD